MRTIHFVLFFLLLILLYSCIFPVPTLATSWFFPLKSFPQRQSLKKFGQLITPEFYLGQESLFPNKFLGYHAGIDLEIFPDELNLKVPVFAITEGTIVYFDNVQGYGGVILERLSDQNLTVLYGHLNIHDIVLGVGDQVQSGQKIAYLGDPFSSDTGGERKHLHLGVYKGTDLYFKGYEADKRILDSKWLNPDALLKSNVKSETPTTPTPAKKPLLNRSPERTQNFFILIYDRLVGFFLNLLLSFSKLQLSI